MNLYDQVNKFCSTLAKSPSSFIAEEAVLQQYNELREQVIKCRPNDVTNRMTRILVGHLRNVDLLSFALHLLYILEEDGEPDGKPSTEQQKKLYTLYVAGFGESSNNMIEKADLVVGPSGAIKDRYGILESWCHIQASGVCTNDYEGDCEHSVGLPGESIPGKHDGPDDTVDEYGKPNGWCWSCWKSYQIEQLQDQIRKMKNDNPSFPQLKSILPAKSVFLNHIVEMTNHDVPGVYESITIELVNNAAREALGFFQTPTSWWSHNQPKSRVNKHGMCPTREMPLIKHALEKLSGDLSYDNVSAAKQILKKIIE